MHLLSGKRRRLSPWNCVADFAGDTGAGGCPGWAHDGGCCWCDGFGARAECGCAAGLQVGRRNGGQPEWVWGRPSGRGGASGAGGGGVARVAGASWSASAGSGGAGGGQRRARPNLWRTGRADAARRRTRGTHKSPATSRHSAGSAPRGRSSGRRLEASRR